MSATRWSSRKNCTKCSAQLAERLSARAWSTQACTAISKGLLHCPHFDHAKPPCSLPQTPLLEVLTLRCVPFYPLESTSPADADVLLCTGY